MNANLRKYDLAESIKLLKMSAHKIPCDEKYNSIFEDICCSIRKLEKLRNEEEIK